jgi:hypothetical protein
MNYGEVLSSAWKTIWKHKVLWLFGILAGLGAGGSGGSGGRSGVNVNGNGNNFGQNFPFGPQVSTQIEHWFQQNWWVIIALLILFFVLFLVVIVLGTFGRIGLARGTWVTDEGKEKISFGELFSASGAYFWRVLLLAILIFAITFALLIVLLVPAIGLTVITFGLGLLCMLPLLCLLIPLSWVLSVIVEQAIVAIVGDNLGVVDGLKRGWEVFRAHLPETLIMGLILGIGGGIVRFIIAIPAFLILIPLIGSAVIDSARLLQTGIIISVVLFCIYIPFAIFFNGVLTAYISSAWALTYRRLTGREKSVPAIEVLPAA